MSGHRNADDTLVRLVPRRPTPKPFRSGPPTAPARPHPPTWQAPGTPIRGTRAVVGHDGVTPVWPLPRGPRP